MEEVAQYAQLGVFLLGGTEKQAMGMTNSNSPLSSLQLRSEISEFSVNS